MRKVIFNGTEGRLEGGITTETACSADRLDAPPHPLHGGTMNNRVVFALFVPEARLFGVAVQFSGVGRAGAV